LEQKLLTKVREIMPDFELRPTSKIWIAEDKIKWRLKQWECLSVERWRRAPVVDDFIADMWPLTPDIETRLEVKVRSSKKADERAKRLHDHGYT
jgi:hypothetical protein